MPKILELKKIDGKLAVILDESDCSFERGSVSLWTEDEAAKQAKDSETLGREQGVIAGLKEAEQMLQRRIVNQAATGIHDEHDKGGWDYMQSFANDLAARISILEREE